MRNPRILPRAPQQAQAPPPFLSPRQQRGRRRRPRRPRRFPCRPTWWLRWTGRGLTQGQIDAILKKRLASVKEKLTAEQKKKLRGDLRKRIIDDFVTRTLLANEIKRRNVKASEQEINEAIQQVKGTGLQPGTTLGGPDEAEWEPPPAPASGRRSHSASSSTSS